MITAHGISQTFTEETGVRQGCILSPLKFIAWMDVLLCWLHDDSTPWLTPTTFGWWPPVARPFKVS